MSIAGKGFFTWKIPLCENGDVQAIAGHAKAAHLTHVLIKVANGIGSYNIDASTGTDHALNLARALRAQGIQVFGWHYVFGDNPIAEANKAIQRIEQLELDCYVVNAEEEYKLPGKRQAAQRFMEQLRRTLPDFPIALSSYRFPAYHMAFPWREFLEACDYNMPQVYWMKASNSGEQLTQCIRQFETITPHRPIVPTGAAFRQNAWQPTAAQVQEFLETARRLNLSAANFWEWSFARGDNLLETWDTISRFAWSATPGQKDICERMVEAWNSGDAGLAGSLYTPRAIHITAARSVQGSDAIRTWYNTLFQQILPEARFTLSGYSGSGSSRHYHWTAVSPQGKVMNGDDTLGLVGERIEYHFSSFRVTP